MKITELLSPAKNLECGLAAINHGADAVYIGASQFGARAAAGNSVTDIETLAQYAHRYRSKVFVALNTILTDNQLSSAEKLIHQVYEAGADALIVQDMGILKLNLPPIPLHASTQTDNRTVEKVKFLQNAGFSRVVLARELSLKQISEISSQTDVELEAFVHGALCVSYSGQCYMSEAMSGRSANRGQCAQYCRLPYHLQDANGNTLIKNKHLLSLKDLDLSEFLPELIKAGIMSFKIEGRLKDVDYVKNITSYYRRKLDIILETNNDYRQASFGKTTFFFESNPAKSFRRGSTDYFLHERHREIIQPETPKSMGELVGKVIRIDQNFFDINNTVPLNNGDGLCFLNRNEELTGFRINKVENFTVNGKNTVRCFPVQMPILTAGISLYRNQDQAFDKILNGKTADRRIAVDIEFLETEQGFGLILTSEDGISCNLNFISEKQTAQKPEMAENSLRQQLSKLGNTIYEAREVTIQTEKSWFFPASTLAEWRRQAVEKLDAVRKTSYQREEPSKAVATSFPGKQLTYLGNVTNHLAESFYRENGVEKIQPGFEVKTVEDVPLMFTKYCIKYEMGWCPRAGNQTPLNEPLYLNHKGQKFSLKFDCRKCEMLIMKA